jgi:hypothetical protein
MRRSCLRNQSGSGSREKAQRNACACAPGGKTGCVGIKDRQCQRRPPGGEGAVGAGPVKYDRWKPEKRDSSPLKERVKSTLRSNEALLKTVDNELATGGVSTEGLSLLTDAGENLHDAILALDLAVHESERDRFAARIEPELGDLAGALVHGFLDVGDSIRKWEFPAFPPGIDLAVRLRALDARVAEIRSTGIGFPIEEILRICAVQLHLKRIASELQLLRTRIIRQVSPDTGAGHRSARGEA